MIDMWHDLDFWDVVIISMLVSAIGSAIGTVWNWWTGRRPNADEADPYGGARTGCRIPRRGPGLALGPLLHRSSEGLRGVHP